MGGRRAQRHTDGLHCPVVVDTAVAAFSYWKTGYCTSDIFASRENCCTNKSPLVILGEPGKNCPAWHQWTIKFWRGYGIYLGFALLYGIVSGGVTMTTKRALPAAALGKGDKFHAIGR